MKIQLKDIIPFKVLLTEASQNPNGLLKVRGVFQKYDEVNANGRIYEKGIWKKILEDKEGIMKRVRERSMLGEMEHPETGQTDLKRVSHVVISLIDDSKGSVIGECDILNTPSGLILKALFEGGVTVGISSRGSGSVVERNGSLYVNAEDYVLDTFDFVYNNSVAGANPKPVAESTATETPKTKEAVSMVKKLDELRKIDLEIGRLAQQNFESLDLSQRSTLLNQLIETRVAIDAAVAEDPSVKTFAEKLHAKLNTMESYIDKKPEAKLAAPAAPAPKLENWEENYKSLKKITEGVINRYKTLKSEIEAVESKGKGEMSPEAAKRYTALKAISEEVVRRYHASVEISEELLARAKGSKQQVQEAQKRYDAAKAICEGMVGRYKGDTIKLFVAGAIAKHPALAESKDELLKSKDVKAARGLIETKLGKKPPVVEATPVVVPAAGEKKDVPAVVAPVAAVAPAAVAPAAAPAITPVDDASEAMTEAIRQTAAGLKANIRENRRLAAFHTPLPGRPAPAAAPSVAAGVEELHESVNVVAKARKLKADRMNG